MATDTDPMKAREVVSERPDPPLSALPVIHASTFSAGLVTLMAAALTSNPYWYLLSGPLLAVSGVLVLLGCQITFRGPAGAIIRAALGEGYLRRATVRGVIWLVVGVLISVWGAIRVQSYQETQPLHDPLLTQVLRPPVAATQALREAASARQSV